MDSPIPPFFQTLLKAKQIRNPSALEVLEAFPITDGDPYIALQNYECYCIGRQKGIRKFIRLKLVSCSGSALMGSHKLLVDGILIRVNSLTTFKQKVLLFEDKVSFSRSTFILNTEKNVCVRLKLLEGRIRLPVEHFQPLEGPVAEEIKTKVQSVPAHYFPDNCSWIEFLNQALEDIKKEIEEWIFTLVQRGNTREIAHRYIAARLGFPSPSQGEGLEALSRGQKEFSTPNDCISFMQPPAQISRDV